MSNAELEVGPDGTPPNYVELEARVRNTYDRTIAALRAVLEKDEEKQDNVLTWRLWREARIQANRNQINATIKARQNELDRINEARDAYYASIGQSRSRRDYLNPNPRGEGRASGTRSERIGN